MSDMLFNLSLILFLLAANGFFVAAEFALVKARDFRIQSLADQGSRSAQLTVTIQNNLEQYLAACQLGITMASLGLGWVGEPAVAALLEPLFHKLGFSEQLLHTISFLLGFLIFSSLHIVIGEQVPKTFAIRKAEPVATATAHLLHWFYLLSYPLNWCLNNASNIILRWLGITSASHAEVLSDEELRGLINTSNKYGEMENDKAKMLHNLFEFDQRSVERIMVPKPDVDVLDLKDSADKHKAIMQRTQHSRLPVVDDDQDNLVGILLVKDLYHAMLDEQIEPWENLKPFLREPLVIPEISPISKAFEAMRVQKTHIACVIDEYGVFSGIVTLEDLLEEIVGEISDELDDVLPEYPVVKQGEEWLAHGLTPLSDVSRITSLTLSEDVDANTLSGLFMQRLGGIPELYDEIEENGYRLIVKEISMRRVQQVLIKPPISLPEPNSQIEVKDSSLDPSTQENDK